MEKYKPYVEKLARFGCYSIAGVYILIGVMAILSFLGLSDGEADEERIVDVILDVPLGEVLIGLMIAGLIGYIIWRVFEAYTDPYNFGSDKKGIAKRTGIALSAVGYVIVAFTAAQILIQGGGGNGEEDQQSMVAQVLDFPGGAWLIGMVGAITGFAGLVQFKYVAGGDYIKRINLHTMQKWKKTVTHILAWAGYIARGIILGIIGYFLISAAITADPEEVGDTDSAFDFLGDFGTVGHILFIAVALGTIGYGLFMILNGYFYSFEEEDNQN
jgi:hypothetical protein